MHCFEVLGRLIAWFGPAYWNKTVESMQAFPIFNMSRYWRPESESTNWKHIWGKVYFIDL